MSALTPDRESATVTQTAIAANVHQPFYVHLHLLAQVALNHALLVNDGANAIYFVFGQFSYSPVNADAGLFQYLIGARAPNTVDVGKTHLCPLICRKVYTGYACHSSSVLFYRRNRVAPERLYSCRSLSLPLLMFRVRADHAHHASAVNDLAVITFFLLMP
jgi:hypothetical protein